MYWVKDGDFQPLWLGSDVVEGVSDAILKKFEVGGDLSESAWLKVGEHNILVGNSATSYSSSFAADKVQIAAYQVATALGLAAISSQLLEYSAVISLAIPLNEFRHRAEIETQLKAIGEGVTVCDRSQQFTVKISFYPEGTGLYLLHRKEREHQMSAPYTRRVVVLMMGHRNLSLLVFEGGKLNANLSQTSDRLGFWNGFKTDASSAGVRERDYHSLLAAVVSGSAEQLSAVEGGVKDFSGAVDVIRQGEMKRLDAFCRDNVIDLLVNSTQTDVLIGGGVAHVLRSDLKDYFAGLGFLEHLYFADAIGGRLLLLAEQTRNAQADLARPMRMADVYGLAQTLLGKIQRP
ncbi:hypothetical protein [Leptodesmis sichuanensis]|uniref:hypothetical protein n=1 Tax=Leptodesmis sichuanensis TaxID=2906798 RepID=UPI001F437C8A|nr:hypothetical protein [Leptodesmis sichuanensis]UIE38877.1 hypothetical protein KIK02_04495 [Leptodesmis sichuanensis A121]